MLPTPEEIAEEAQTTFDNYEEPTAKAIVAAAIRNRDAAWEAREARLEALLRQALPYVERLNDLAKHMRVVNHHADSSAWLAAVRKELDPKETT